MAYETQSDGHEQQPANRGETLMRGLVMILFAILFNIAQSLLGVMAILQFFWKLVTGEKNIALSDFGTQLAAWMAEVARFQTFASEERPFPWGPFPRG